jgi:hypothetical protein
MITRATSVFKHPGIAEALAKIHRYRKLTKNIFIYGEITFLNSNGSFP